MKGLLDWENPLVQIYLKILDIIGLSILWLIACLPVVTIGASTSALYYTVVKTLRNSRGYVFKSFVTAFKECFRQSTLLTVAYLAVMYIFYLDMTIMEHLETKISYAGDFWWIFGGIEVLLSLYFVLACFQIARFQNHMGILLKNTLLLGIRHMGSTLGVAAVIGFGIFSAWCVPLLAIVLPAVCTWVISILTEKVYSIYMNPQDKAREDKWNLIKR